MACLGVHFAIPKSLAERLIAAPDDDSLIELIQQELEEPWDEDFLFETDKAWDALHRCLSDGTLDGEGTAPPLELAIVGGDVLTESEDYYVAMLDPEEVQAVAKALAGVTREWLRARYDSLEFPDYPTPKGDEDFEYSWSNFEGLPAFFARAAHDHRYVIFTVDQ